MGELIRFVSAHEVGHTIGLQHNMQSSAAYSVEQLRTRFVCEMGVAPSIMDYARFNYVAQPGDDTCYYPVVGPYDKFAIEWGYKHYPGEDRYSEREELRDMVADMQDDPVYRFSSPTGMDPTALTEAIGDDAMRASNYGVENLKRTVDQLTDWTYQEGEDYSQLQELYQNVVSQWQRYTGHVAANIGGVVTTRKRQGQDGVPYEMVDKETQARALEYLNQQVFATPEWMIDSDIFRRFQPTGALTQIRGGQSSGLNQVLNVARMNRLVEQEAFHGDDAYSLGEMLDDLRAGVWTEVTSGRRDRRVPAQPAARLPGPHEDAHVGRQRHAERRRDLRPRPADDAEERAGGRGGRPVAPGDAVALPGRDRAHRSDPGSGEQAAAW